MTEELTIFDNKLRDREKLALIVDRYVKIQLYKHRRVHSITYEIEYVIDCFNQISQFVVMKWHYYNYEIRFNKQGERVF